MNLRNTMNIENNHLVIGGIDTVDLAQQYGTPLYVMDVSYIRAVTRAFAKTIEQRYGKGHVSYASKAFSCTAIYKILSQEGAYADVVSYGELYTAKQAGFAMKNLRFHGNNKSLLELKMAIEYGVGVIVVDSLDEITLLDSVCEEYRVTQDVEIRVNPGVEAHTHSYIQTAKIDSKFGFGIPSGFADVAISKILKTKNLHLKGIACHIGSQIFDANAFRLAVDVMTDYMVAIKTKFGVEIEELNLGGGFAIHYTEKDPKYTVDEYCGYINIIVEELLNCVEQKKIKKPTLVVEPGRSLVGEAGITLYTIESSKEIPNIRKYLFINGGMFDNIRPALYDAEYEAIIANRADDEKVEKVSIAGKCCESGDIIIQEIMLPKSNNGDILAVFSTGAYNYSMANNYNRNAVPPVVFVENGKSDYAVKPQDLQDIIRNDNMPSWLK